MISNKDHENMKKRQDDEERLVRRLRRDGHICISIAESYHIQVSWCGETVCTDNKDVYVVTKLSQSKMPTDIDYADMRKRNDEQEEFVRKLRQDGISIHY